MHKKKKKSPIFSEGDNKKKKLFLYTLAKRICPLCLNLRCVDMFEKVAELH